jgi:flavin reductase (DIM6/NTAB) family NADH-FMN oxidoreductase RutF
MPEFDPTALSTIARARLITRLVAPRPIAFVSTLSAEGVGNLAPFSFFNAGGHSPMSCVFSAGRDRHCAGKHTLANIEATGQYVINVSTRAMAERINKASFEYPANVDEFDVTGFTRVPSVRVKPPRVGESPISLECELHTIVPHGSGPGSASYIIGEIVLIHVDDSVCVDGLPDERLVGLVARGGADRWVTIEQHAFFPLPRPTTP